MSLLLYDCMSDTTVNNRIGIRFRLFAFIPPRLVIRFVYRIRDFEGENARQNMCTEGKLGVWGSSGYLLFGILHQFDQIVEENVAVAVAEALDFVADFAGVVVDREAGLPRLEMLMAADTRTQFL